MKWTPLALASVLAASAFGVSNAQPTPGMAARAPAAEGRAWQRPDPAQMAERHAEHLRALLQLRPDQEPALRALVAALQPSAARMERREGERDALRQATTPERLDRMQARLAERQGEFARRADAIKRFYAQLTPAQQRAFDALPMMMMGHGMKDHDHGGGWEHGRDGHGRGGMGPGAPRPPMD
jgi:hypothetical protein